MVCQVQPKVELIGYSNNPGLPATAAKFCTSILPMEELVFTDGNWALLDRVIGMGHESVLEHFTLSFGISGISRVTECQLMRHRLASYSVKSGRYTKIAEQYDAVVPTSVTARNLGYKVTDLYQQAHRLYLELLEEGIPPEDARYVLPQATATQLVLTMNARELLHFFGERCCSGAQWEIREMADKMRKICQKSFPGIFKWAGPKCVKAGRCIEQKTKWETCRYSPHKSEV